MDEFIAKHLQGVSRTYAVVVPMLPEPLDDAVGVAYLLMRIVDTLEDAAQLSAAERVQLLGRLDDALAGDVAATTALTRPIGDLAAERELMQATGEVLRRVRALEPAYCTAVGECARAMRDGVRTLIARSEQRNMAYPAVRNTAELREYCYYVAGTVGEMLCAMMAHYLGRSELGRLREPAVELGIGLQLVNILKDALKDSYQGRRYLPPIESRDAAQAEIHKAVLADARRSLLRGLEFVLALPADAPGLRSFCGLPIAWGGLTLARAERDPENAKIGRDAITSSIELFGRIAGDDRALREELTALLRPSECSTAAPPARS